MGKRESNKEEEEKKKKKKKGLQNRKSDKKKSRNLRETRKKVTAFLKKKHKNSDGEELTARVLRIRARLELAKRNCRAGKLPLLQRTRGRIKERRGMDISGGKHLLNEEAHGAGNGQVHLSRRRVSIRERGTHRRGLLRRKDGPLNKATS